MTEDYSEEPSLSQPSSYYQQIAKTVMSGSPAHLKVIYMYLNVINLKIYLPFRKTLFIPKISYGLIKTWTFSSLMFSNFFQVSISN
jgi:hypothetical protein